MNNPIPSFWSLPVDALLDQLQTSRKGLSTETALERAGDVNELGRHKASPWSLLVDQFKSPIILLLFASAVMSYFLNDQTNAVIILFILFASGLLGFWQEWSAADAVERLMAMIESKATVLRDGRAGELAVDSVVSGDIVMLKVGDVIPGDGRIIESRDLFVNEAALTGESFPAEKAASVVAQDQSLSRRTNSVFLGTHVISGTAAVVIVHTGASTEFGHISGRLEKMAPESGFERGLRNFGNLLIKVAVSITVVVLTIKLAGHKPFNESLLLALSLAVGMTPQLLPAITAVVMASGAKSMARVKVIVKQLLAIENFGSMTILCSDKTGTLTEGAVRLHAAYDLAGANCKQVSRFAYLNAVLQQGFTNPIDLAICEAGTFDLTGVKKLDEVPYDFGRKRLSVLIDDCGQRTMLTKGAMTNILECCAFAESSDRQIHPIAEHRNSIDQLFFTLSDQGYRVLGLAYRRLEQSTIEKTDEADLTFLGFLIFHDPPKAGIVETLSQLRELGVSLKMITGDNQIVAAAIGRQVGLDNPRMITGHELRQLTDEAICQQVVQVDLFAEIEPNQKEQIILALKRTGHVVGYMGDGINDASALHAADVGISVASAVDVAKDAAQVVLLEQDLSVLIKGVREGRRTFANTLKYIFFVVAGNFGYMFSLAVASISLRWLLTTSRMEAFDEPLLPGQILLINLMADFPAMALASDNVDSELIERPRKWDLTSLTRFMIVFGISSSLFDFLTFGICLFFLHTNEISFHTVWFVQCVLTGLLIMLVVRTRRPFYRSRPGGWLMATIIFVSLLGVALPFSPFASRLGFVPLTWAQLISIMGICIAYGLGMECVKALYNRFSPAEEMETPAIN